MSQKGNTQVTFIFTATPDQVAEGDRIFSSHAEWVERTHHRDGDLELMSYNVVKGPELSSSLDPASAPTGNTSFVLAEVYKSPAGLADHWNNAGTWEDFPAFVEWAGKQKVAVLHGSPVIQSNW